MYLRGRGVKKGVDLYLGLDFYYVRYTKFKKVVFYDAEVKEEHGNRCTRYYRYRCI